MAQTPRKRTERIIDGPGDVVVMGSDAKSKTPVVSECKLCRKHTTLLLSHVIPKWTARWAKAEGIPVGYFRSIGVTTAAPDWPKHYLLCFACEQYLGESEEYVARLTRGTEADLSAIGVSLQNAGYGALLENVDSNLVFRAVAGTFLRAHFATSFLFEETKISPNAVHELRSAIMAGYYPSRRMALFAWKLVNTTIPGANPRSVLHLDFQREPKGVMFEFLAAGMAWTFYLGDAQRWRRDFADSVGDTADSRFLGVDTHWFLGCGEWTQHRQVEAANDFFAFNESTEAPVPSLIWGPCPCYLGGTIYSECCLARWLPRELGHGPSEKSG